jgi:hypothetical protein
MVIGSNLVIAEFLGRTTSGGLVNEEIWSAFDLRDRSGDSGTGVGTAGVRGRGASSGGGSSAAAVFYDDKS